MCNPRQVELPNLVTHYIAVKEYVHSCLTWIRCYFRRNVSKAK
jgi:hypothetical protein